jgi:hypothetical protein
MQVRTTQIIKIQGRLLLPLLQKHKKQGGSTNDKNNSNNENWGRPHREDDTKTV